MKVKLGFSKILIPHSNLKDLSSLKTVSVSALKQSSTSSSFGVRLAVIGIKCRVRL